MRDPDLIAFVKTPDMMVKPCLPALIYANDRLLHKQGTEAHTFGPIHCRSKNPEPRALPSSTFYCRNGHQTPEHQEREKYIFYEKYILSDALPQGIFWRRYVDDIFCLWSRGRNIDEFMLVINNLVPSVTFTFERERTMNSVFRF